MNTTESDDTYEKWLARRRQDFSGADLSFLVMASVRKSAASVPERSGLRTPYLGVPSAIVGGLRCLLILLLILIPA